LFERSFFKPLTGRKKDQVRTRGRDDSREKGERGEKGGGCYYAEKEKGKKRRNVFQLPRRRKGKGEEERLSLLLSKRIKRRKTSGQRRNLSPRSSPVHERSLPKRMAKKENENSFCGTKRKKKKKSVLILRRKRKACFN